jgi:hypothetical protein
MNDTCLPEVTEVTATDNATNKQLKNATLEHAENHHGELVLCVNTAIR